MKKYRTQYLILDDFGDTIRIVLEKPSDEYKYVKERVLLWDSDDWEEADF